MCQEKGTERLYVQFLLVKVLPSSVSLAPTESSIPLAVGLTAAGTSLMTVASFVLWLLKRLRKRGKGAWERTPKMFLKNVFFFPHW